MMLKRSLLLLSGLCCLAVSAPAGLAQSQTYPAFTLTIETTDYDPQGNATLVARQTRYNSSSGNWRFVSYGPNERVSQTLFLQGKGVFFADERNKQFVKMSDCVIAKCLPRRVSAESLQADPKYITSERILGFLTYIHKNARGELTYFAPELGDVPFKRITMLNGYKRVEEPIKITLGEPTVDELRGPDYQLIDERPVFENDLGASVIDKPAPQFPTTVLPVRKPVEVTVEVITDEAGNVVNAWCVGAFTFSAFGRAAEEAAYHARFPPRAVAGKPIRSMGLIKYSVQ